MQIHHITTTAGQSSNKIARIPIIAVSTIDGFHALKVFIVLASEADYLGKVSISSSGIAEKLNMFPSNVRRAITSLIKQEVISKIEHHIGETPTYKLSSKYFLNNGVKNNV